MESHFPQDKLCLYWKKPQIITDPDEKCVFWIWRQYFAAKELQALQKTLGCKMITNGRNSLRK